MKKAIAALLCSTMLSSFILCGCTKATETSVTSSETESQTETTSEETTAKPAETTKPDPEINSDNLSKVAEAFKSKNNTGLELIDLYSSGIRGNGRYFMDESGALTIIYYGLNNSSSFEVKLEPGRQSVDVSFYIGYNGKFLNGYGTAGVRELEKFIDDVIAGNDEYIEYIQKDALPDYSESIKKDLPIVYSRFIAAVNTAFPELGFKIEDLGIEPGSKYSSVDPTQPLSNEPVIKNDLAFKNGISSDKKTTWTTYMFNAIGTLGGMKGKDYRSAYGQRSSSMFTPSDYVQYSTSGKKLTNLFYYHMYDSSKYSESLSINVDDKSTKKKKNVTSYMTYQYEQKVNSKKSYLYTVTISAKPGQYDKVFASKASFKKYAKADLFVMKKGSGSSAWGKKANISKLKKSFKSDKCTYYTKDQILDYFWERHEAMIQSLDTGMVWMDTSLADVGINWKKSA